MKTVWLHFTLLGAALCGDSFAEHRGEVRLDNPFGRGFPVQPAQSLLTVKRDLLPKGVPFSIESLNKHVGLKDEVIGQMIRVQWSVLRLDQFPQPAEGRSENRLRADDLEIQRLMRHPVVERRRFRNLLN